MTKRFGFDAKLERADQHIVDFKKAEEVFLKKNPYAVIEYCELHSRDYVMEYRVFEECPDYIIAIIGDAIHNLRAALDHLTYKLEVVHGHTPDKNTQFIVYKNEAAFISQRHDREVRYGTRFADLIDETKPYLGGDEFLAALTLLDNIDKHRLLITTVASTTGVGTFGKDLAVRDTILRLPKFGKVRTGEEFYRRSGGEADVQVRVAFSIAFGEVREDFRASFTLSRLRRTVASVLDRFRPLL
ncbi:hypothetical protein [Candidatus Binatus sp.]|uniref:hypothetical protein n=1 Tax=Candidatus Binatus sp. TaxID=2811406 RepID=UPI003C8429C6